MTDKDRAADNRLREAPEKLPPTQREAQDWPGPTGAVTPGELPSGDRTSVDKGTTGLEKPEIFGILPVPLGNQFPSQLVASEREKGGAPKATTAESKAWSHYLLGMASWAS